jgi:hypothetical protein
MHGDVPLAVRLVPRGLGKAPAHLLEHMQDVLAGAEGALAKVRAGAVGLAGLRATQSHAVGLAGGGVRDRVVGPDFVRIPGREVHFLRARALLAFRDGLGNERLLAQALQGLALERRT